MNLRIKLLLPFVLLLATVFSYSTFVMIPSYIELIKNTKIEQESTYIDLLSTALLPDLLESDLANMYTTLNNVLSERKHWYSLSLYNPDGIRLYPLVEKNLPSNKELDPLVKDVVFNGTNYASVKLLLDVSETTNREIDFVQSLKTSVLFILFATFAVMFVMLETTVRKPLTTLTNLAFRIAKGNYNVPVDIKAKDEVGQLGSALETMRDSIQEREQAMSYYASIQNTIRLIQSKFISEQETSHVFLELQRHILLLTRCQAGFIGELQQDGKNHPYLKPYALNKVVRVSTEKTLVFNHGQEIEELRELNSLLGEVMLQGQPVMDNGPEIPADRLGFPIASNLDCENFLGLPLYSGYQFVGVLCLINREGAFDQDLFEDLEVLLQALAQLIVAYRERQTLIDSEARLRTVIDNSVEGIISTDQFGVITEFNAAAERIFGYSNGQICGRVVTTLVPDDFIQEYTLLIWDEFQDSRVRQINREFEVSGLHRSGKQIPLEVSVAKVFTMDGVQYTGIIRDITERKEQEEALSQAYADLQEAHELLAEQNRRDSLTGLANRRFMEEKLRQEWEHAVSAPKQSYLTLILCDIDYFKKYNDTYGHPQGDVCLSQVAAMLGESFTRESDLVARYGGEEFLIVSPNTSPEAAMSLAEKMRERVWNLNLKHEASGAADRVTISVGVYSFYPGTGSLDMAAAIQQADNALYLAKEQGRNRVVLAEN
ncbi:MAG: diguanylate cyclase [Thiolinea sp.]